MSANESDIDNYEDIIE